MSKPKSIDTELTTLVNELLPTKYEDYNYGLLPDEDGYDEVKSFRKFQSEEARRSVIEAIQKFVDDECIKARIEENQIRLDRINNFVPDPNTPSFGSASGAFEVSSLKHSLEDRIAELTATESPLKPVKDKK